MKEHGLISLLEMFVATHLAGNYGIFIRLATRAGIWAGWLLRPAQIKLEFQKVQPKPELETP